MMVLLAVDEQDAEQYKERFPELAGVRVFTIDDRARLEGARITGAYATAAARWHDDYDRAYRIVHNSFVLTQRLAPRIL